MKEKRKFQIPSVGCILLSVVLIGFGCIFAYLEWFRGYEFGRRYSGLSGIIFFMLGVMVLYRGVQGKEFRFWHKDWQPMGKEAVEKELDDVFICPYCKNKLKRKEENCPICGRKI